MVTHQGKVHDYLGMIFDFSKKGKVMVHMIEYIKNINANFPEEITTTKTGQATDHLFAIAGGASNGISLCYHATVIPQCACKV